MKQKDVLYAVLAGIIFLVAGYVGYTQLLPKNNSATSGTVQVDKVGAIPAELDANGLARIRDASKVIDYNGLPDFSGLGTAAPFGQ